MCVVWRLFNFNANWDFHMVNLRTYLIQSLYKAFTCSCFLVPAEAPCKKPSSPKNGSVVVWGNGFLVEYTCHESLFPIGQTFGSCNPVTKQWSINRPTCVCKYLKLFILTYSNLK